MGDSLNVAVEASLSAVVVDEAMPIASDEPRLSSSMSRALWRSRPFFVSAAQITPDETTSRRLAMSHRPGSASSARRMGLANASPTIDIEFTRSRSMVSSSSTGSKWRPCTVTTEPPSIRQFMALNAPVPCMSGAAGTFTGPGLGTRAASAAGSGSSGSGRLALASIIMMTSSWRHMTPFGMPVVPPV